MKFSTFILTLLLYCFTTSRSSSMDIFWTGNAGDDDWFNVMNWSPQQVPTIMDTVYLMNPPAGNLTVAIDNGDAECYNLHLSGTGYTLEVIGNASLSVANDLICYADNIMFNRAEIDVGNDVELNGFLDNNFGSYLNVCGKLWIQVAGSVNTTGNAVNASNIICYDMDNDGIIENEDMSQITVSHELYNTGDISNYNFAVLEVQGIFNNSGTLHNHKKTSLIVTNTFENHGSYISEDKAILNGLGTLEVFNWGTIQNIDQSDFIDIKNVFNFNLISNEDKGGFYVSDTIENSGTIQNDFYVETGMIIRNLTGALFINTDEINCLGYLYNDGFIDNQSDWTTDADMHVDVNGVVDNTGCFTVNGNSVVGGLYKGTLMNYGSISGSGTYTYNRNTGGFGLPPDFNGWHLISTPVSGMSCHDIFDYWINDWDETINSWFNYSPSSSPCVAGPDNPLDPMKGYNVKRDLEYTCSAVNPATGAIIEFTGTASGVGTGNQSAMLTGSDFEPGDPNQMNNWNLIGNPFPSAIDASQIGFPSEIDNAIYYFNEATLTYESFVGGVGQPFIPVSQGFFVHTNTPGSFTFSFDNSVRTCNGDGIWYKKEISDLLTIEITGKAGFSDKTYVRKLGDATKGFDKEWDAYKLLSQIPGIPQVFSVLGNISYSVNTLDYIERLPVTFIPGYDGDFILKVKGSRDFDLVYLEDKITGIVQNLKTNPVYRFHAIKANPIDRFILHFEDYASELSKNGFIIYSKQNNIYILNRNNVEGEITVLNLLGQQVSGKSLEDGLNRIPLDSAGNLYFVQVSSSGFTLCKKVYCR